MAPRLLTATTTDVRGKVGAASVIGRGPPDEIRKLCCIDLPYTAAFFMEIQRSTQNNAIDTTASL